MECSTVLENENIIYVMTDKHNRKIVEVKLVIDDEPDLNAFSIRPIAKRLFATLMDMQDIPMAKCTVSEYRIDLGDVILKLSTFLGECDDESLEDFRDYVDDKLRTWEHEFRGFNLNDRRNEHVG